jgi:hypothetical protein
VGYGDADPTNEIDDKALIDLWGVVKVSEVTVHGISVLNFDGFAPAARWEELSIFTDSDRRGSELLILNWFAIPGSPLSLTWPRWYLSANGW